MNEPTPPQPPLSVNGGPPPSIWERKLPFTGYWSRFAFANSSTRREAKAILFQELAVAVRHGMPLDEALDCCMQTKRAWTGESGAVKETQPYRMFQWLFPLFFYLMLAFGGIILMLLVSTWAADVERVARVLALRLLPLVRAGHSLSSAMALLPQDYRPDEVEMIRAGEEWNNLPTAMERLGQFQYYERDIQRHWGRMAYPVWLSALMFSIMTFVLIFIVPKFQDIYYQLGAELPGPTQLLLDAGRIIVQFGAGILPLIALLLFWFFVLRMFMVGSRVLRNVAGALLVGSFAIAGISTAVAMMESNYVVFSGGFIFLYIAIIILVGSLAVVVAMALLMRLERMVLYLERRLSGWFGRIPFVGAPLQTERESRWLGALSMALASGVDSDKAIESAGRISGKEFSHRSARAAELVRGGHSIGKAVLEAGILRQRYAHRLRMLDDRPAYLQGLADIAEDAARDSFHALNRASRVGEVASVCLIGLLSLLFAIGMYMPIFNITKIVGVY